MVKRTNGKRLNSLVRGYSTTANNPAIRFHSTQSEIKDFTSDYESASTQEWESQEGGGQGRDTARERGEHTIIKININQPLFPQFLLETGLGII
jgi:hypothetical protein